MDLESQLSRETIPRIKHQYKCKCDLKNMIQKSKETFISAFFFYVDYVVIFSPWDWTYFASSLLEIIIPKDIAGGQK